MIFDVKISGQTLTVPSGLVLASGARETVKVRLMCDRAWDGLTLTLTCRTAYGIGVVARTVPALTPDIGVAIPAECMIPGGLFLGVTGYGSDGTEKLTTAKMLRHIEIRSSEDDDHPVGTQITPEMAEQLLSVIGLLSKLSTKDRTSIVAAINEVLGAANESVKEVNGIAPDGDGTVQILGQDILAYPEKIPGFEGTVDDALDKLAETLYTGNIPKWDNALQSYSDVDDAVGLPILDTASRKYVKLIIDGTQKEMDGERKIFAIPTVGATDNMIREAMLSGYVDVTNDYENAFTAGTVTCAREFLWTLGEGRYSLVDGTEKYYLLVFVGELSEENHRQTKRILLRVGEFLDVEIHSINGAYTRTPDFKIDGETGHIFSNGKQCNPTELSLKDGKLYLSNDGYTFGDGVPFNASSGSGIEVSGAKVGDFLKVAAVDENGVPTAWTSESPSMPSWKHLRTVTIPEDITADMSGVMLYESSDGTGVNFGFDTDKNGNPFAVNELFIYCEARNSAAGTGTKEVVLYPLGSVNSNSYCYRTAMKIGCAESSTHQTTMCAKCHIIGVPGLIFGWGVTGSSTTASATTRQFGSAVPVPFTSVRLLPEYNATCGFLPGSKFHIYGR